MPRGENGGNGGEDIARGVRSFGKSNEPFCVSEMASRAPQYKHAKQDLVSLTAQLVTPCVCMIVETGLTDPSQSSPFVRSITPVSVSVDLSLNSVNDLVVRAVVIADADGVINCEKAARRPTTILVYITSGRGRRRKL